MTALAGKRARLPAVGLRLLQFSLGAAGILTGCLLFESSLLQANLRSGTERIKAGESISRQELRTAAENVNRADNPAFCNPRLTMEAALHSLRFWDTSLDDGDLAAADRWNRRAEMSVRRSLACAPVDSFAWFALFKLIVTREGYSPKYLPFLEMSYETGPREGWIILNRNPVSLALFDGLPAKLQQRSIDEYCSILQSGLYEEGRSIFLRAPSNVRSRILDGLATVDLRHREAFAKALTDVGYDAEIVGVPKREARPW